MGVRGLSTYARKQKLGEVHTFPPQEGGADPAATARADSDLAQRRETIRLVGDGCSILYWLFTPESADALRDASSPVRHSPPPSPPSLSSPSPSPMAPPTSLSQECVSSPPSPTEIPSPPSPLPAHARPSVLQSPASCGGWSPSSCPPAPHPPSLQWILGGDYAALRSHTTQFVRALRRCGVLLECVYMDGANEPEKLATYVARRAERSAQCTDIHSYLCNSHLFFDSQPKVPPRTSAPSASPTALLERYAEMVQRRFAPGGSVVLPLLAEHCFVAALGECGVPVVYAHREADPELEQYCADHPACFGVLASDSDYLVSPLVSRYVHLQSVRFREGAFQAQVYRPGAIAQHFGLRVSCLPLLSCLVGNDRTRFCRGLAWEEVISAARALLRSAPPRRGGMSSSRGPAYSSHIDMWALFLRKQVAVAGHLPEQLERRVVKQLGTQLSATQRTALARTLIGCCDVGAQREPAEVRVSLAEPPASTPPACVSLASESPAFPPPACALTASSSESPASTPVTPAPATPSPPASIPPAASTSTPAPAAAPERTAPTAAVPASAATGPLNLVQWVEVHRQDCMSALLDLVQANAYFGPVFIGASFGAYRWSATQRHRFLARALSSCSQSSWSRASHRHLDEEHREGRRPEIANLTEWTDERGAYRKQALTVQHVEPARRLSSAMEVLRGQLGYLPESWPPADSSLALLLGVAAVRSLCTGPVLECWEAELLLQHVCACGSGAEEAKHFESEANSGSSVAWRPVRSCARAVVVANGFQLAVRSLLAEVQLYTRLPVSALKPWQLFSAAEWVRLHMCADPNSATVSRPGSVAQKLFAHRDLAQQRCVFRTPRRPGSRRGGRGASVNARGRNARTPPWSRGGSAGGSPAREGDWSRGGRGGRGRQRCGHWPHEARRTATWDRDNAGSNRFAAFLE
jgi:hypothetical protein